MIAMKRRKILSKKQFARDTVASGSGDDSNPQKRKKKEEDQMTAQKDPLQLLHDLSAQLLKQQNGGQQELQDAKKQISALKSRVAELEEENRHLKKKYGLFIRSSAGFNDQMQRALTGMQNGLSWFSNKLEMVRNKDNEESDETTTTAPKVSDTGEKRRNDRPIGVFARKEISGSQSKSQRKEIKYLVKWEKSDEQDFWVRRKTLTGYYQMKPKFLPTNDFVRLHKDPETGRYTSYFDFEEQELKAV